MPYQFDEAIYSVTIEDEDIKVFDESEIFVEIPTEDTEPVNLWHYTGKGVYDQLVADDTDTPVWKLVLSSISDWVPEDAGEEIEQVDFYFKILNDELQLLFDEDEPILYTSEEDTNKRLEDYKERVIDTLEFELEMEEIEETQFNSFKKITENLTEQALYQWYTNLSPHFFNLVELKNLLLGLDQSSATITDVEDKLRHVIATQFDDKESTELQDSYLWTVQQQDIKQLTGLDEAQSLWDEAHEQYDDYPVQCRRPRKNTNSGNYDRPCYRVYSLNELIEEGKISSVSISMNTHEILVHWSCDSDHETSEAQLKIGQFVSRVESHRSSSINKNHETSAANVKRRNRIKLNQIGTILFFDDSTDPAGEIRTQALDWKFVWNEQGPEVSLQNFRNACPVSITDNREKESLVNVTRITDGFEDLERERIHFIIHGKAVTPAFANTIRRTILSYVETLAIEEIVMVENTSPLFDEYVAHRLGLVPLSLDKEQIDLNNQLDCEICEGVGCEACTVTLTLTQETDSSSDMVVYSRELISNNTFVYPRIDEIPILKMGPDQRLILEAQARLGTGREHAKWQPTASLGYQYVPEIDIDTQELEMKEEAAVACPRDVFDYDEENDSLNIDNLLNCNLCMECVKITDGKGIDVKGDPNRLMFIVEGTGALRVEDILMEAADIINDMANNFKESFQIALEEVENDPSIMRKVSTFEQISEDTGV